MYVVINLEYLAMYFVICRLDDTPEGNQGKYVLATSRYFDTLEAAITYASTLAPGREPKVCETREVFISKRHAAAAYNLRVDRAINAQLEREGLV